MTLTIYTTSIKETFDDVKSLLAYLEQEMPPRLRGKITTARELVTETENEAVDQGCDL